MLLILVCATSDDKGVIMLLILVCATSDDKGVINYAFNIGLCHIR